VEVVCASKSCAGGGGEEVVAVEMGKRCSLTTLDITGSSGFGYEFRALNSASISRSGNPKEKPGSGLAAAHTKVFSIKSPPRSWQP